MVLNLQTKSNYAGDEALQMVVAPRSPLSKAKSAKAVAKTHQNAARIGEIGQAIAG
jgi:hypothetical protein